MKSRIQRSNEYFFLFCANWISQPFLLANNKVDSQETSVSPQRIPVTKSYFSHFFRKSTDILSYNLKLHLSLAWTFFAGTENMSFHFVTIPSNFLLCGFSSYLLQFYFLNLFRTIKKLLLFFPSFLLLLFLGEKFKTYDRHCLIFSYAKGFAFPNQVFFMP